MTERVATISPVRLIVILAVTFLVLFGATWMILISPKQSKESSLESQVKTAQSQLAKLSSNAPAAHKHVVSQSLLLTRAMPNDAAMPQILYQLSRIATEEHVSFDSIAPGTPTSYSGYESVPMTVQLTGTFFAVEGFLQQLRNQVQISGADVSATGRLYDVLSLTVQSVNPPPKVSATLTLNAFAYTGIGLTPPAGTTTTSSG
ncbi:MAG TPA: type 4a pilus biogenesis protein PilO [Gaiellaceae bacterium]|nr:type 4a pilus biogenesis protein PilO [Gaiellaceae bacterium]